MTAPLAGVVLLVRVNLRTGWKALAAWVVGLVALFAITGASISELFGTPEKLAGYAASVGDSVIMLNGRIAGMATAGGVVANEFAFILSLALPVMATALVARGTRKEEESGRVELLLSARVGRLAPLVAALVVAGGAIAVLGAGIWIATLSLDVDRAGALFYAGSLIATGWVYVGVTAVLAQVVAHNRTLWMASMATSILTLLLRGIGDTRETWLTWLSPLGWQGQVRSFGDARLWPLLLALAVAGTLVALALWLDGRRDVGGALMPSNPGPRGASEVLRTQTGVTLHKHTVPFFAWTAGIVALMTTYGALMQVVLDTLAESPELVAFLGSPGDLLDSVLQMIVRFVGFLAAGFALQALGGMRAEEVTGRLELLLAGRRSRWSWMGIHTAVVMVGSVFVAVAGTSAFAVSTAVSLGEPQYLGRIVAAGLWQLPAVLVFIGLSVALFGALPRLQPVAWVTFAAALVVTMMGPTLQLTASQIRSSPFSLVGDSPGGAVSAAGVLGLCAATVVLVASGLVAFRRRDVPRS